MLNQQSTEIMLWRAKSTYNILQNLCKKIYQSRIIANKIKIYLRLGTGEIDKNVIWAELHFK